MNAGRTWHSTATAAEYADRHVQTIRKAVEAGELHGTQRVTGGRWRIHVDCLDAWVEGRACERHALPKKRAVA